MNPQPVSGDDPRGSARLGQEVYGELKELLLTAAVAPGERLYESGVAERFGASRTPVREALMQLQKERLLEREGRAYVVRRITHDDLMALYEARECLECRMVAMAARRRTDGDVDVLRGLVARMDGLMAQGEVGAFNSVDLAFHLEIARMSGNAVMMEMLASLHDRIRMVRSALIRGAEGMALANADHRRILSAIERGTPEIAAAEMREHLGTANLAKALADGPFAAQR